MENNPLNLPPKIENLHPMTISAIHAEALRAQATHGWGSTPLNPDMPRGSKLAILMEEVGEVAKELCEFDLGKIEEDQLNARLVQELIQVASVAASWAEAEDEGEVQSNGR